MISSRLSHPAFCLALSIRTLRGSSSVITRGHPPSKTSDIPTAKKDLVQSGEFTKLPDTQPARHIKVPDRPPPAGLETVDKWKSPLVTDPLTLKKKRERYEMRFLVADEINAKLEQCANDPIKILEIVHKYQNKCDNMNVFNALGFLNASFNPTDKIQTPNNKLSPSTSRIFADLRFLNLCNLLYKKSRSYPPNACIANVARLLDLGVPFRTPLIYVFLSLLKQSINGLTTTDALTLAKIIAPFRSMRLPTALNAGIQALLQKQADEDFDRFVADLGNENAHHRGELNLTILVQLFGDSLTPIVRNRLFTHVVNNLIGHGALSGSHLVKFVSALNNELVSLDYVNKCLLKLENDTTLTVFDAADISRTCLSFRRLKDPVLLKKLSVLVNQKLEQFPIADEAVLTASKAFLHDLVKLNFAAPNLFRSLVTRVGASSLSNEVGISDFLEATITHLHDNSEAMVELVTDPNFQVDWNNLDAKSKLILYHMKNVYNIDIPFLPSNFPSCFDQIEEMLANVTNDNSFDLTEKMNILPQMLSLAKLSGLRIGDSDLVVRMYIPAVEQDLASSKTNKNKKLFIVPVSASDFYQNRFDVIWTCRLRFFLLQRFLCGSDEAISVIPVNLMRFRSLTSEREKFHYVRECLSSKGDRDLVELLHL